MPFIYLRVLRLFLDFERRFVFLDFERRFVFLDFERRRFPPPGLLSPSANTFHARSSAVVFFSFLNKSLNDERDGSPPLDERRLLDEERLRRDLRDLRRLPVDLRLTILFV
jgi:hypothetical protein